MFLCRYVPLFVYLFICRAYASNLKKPYELTYDPFTHSVTILNDKENVESFAEKVKTEVELLQRAIEKMDGDNYRKRTTDSE